MAWLCELSRFVNASTSSRCFRQFSTTSSRSARRNPRSRPKTVLDLPPHLQDLFEGRQEYEYPHGLHGYGVRLTGYVDGQTNKFVEVQELIPELIVPDLKDFKLKAYVSYRAQDTVEPEHSPRDLFDAIYGMKLKDDFEAGKLDEDVAETEERAKLGLLKTHTYDREPLRMLDTSKVPVTEKIDWICKNICLSRCVILYKKVGGKCGTTRQRKKAYFSPCNLMPSIYQSIHCGHDLGLNLTWVDCGELTIKTNDTLPLAMSLDPYETCLRLATNALLSASSSPLLYNIGHFKRRIHGSIL